MTTTKAKAEARGNADERTNTRDQKHGKDYKKTTTTSSTIKRGVWECRAHDRLQPPTIGLSGRRRPVAVAVAECDRGSSAAA